MAPVVEASQFVEQASQLAEQVMFVELVLADWQRQPLLVELLNSCCRFC